jgi:hypothetical protein
MQTNKTRILKGLLETVKAEKHTSSSSRSTDHGNCSSQLSRTGMAKMLLGREEKKHFTEYCSGLYIWQWSKLKTELDEILPFPNEVKCVEGSARTCVRVPLRPMPYNMHEVKLIQVLLIN